MLRSKYQGVGVKGSGVSVGVGLGVIVNVGVIDGVMVGKGV